MRRLRTSYEGYLMIDHRASPGLTAEEMRQAGYTNAPNLGEGTYTELPTIRCAHCSNVFIKNPLRTRERGFCWQCDDYLCDQCTVAMKVSGKHVPFQQIADSILGSDKTAPTELFIPLTLRALPEETTNDD